MHRFSGLLLMLTGTAVGAYTYLPPPQNSEDTLAEVTRISAAPDRAVRSPLTGTTIIEKAGTPNDDTRTRVATKAALPWTAVVTETTSAAAPLKSSKPGDAVTRYELTRDLQRELKRAGCYGGEIHGSWTAATKRAMAVFMDRVNATLPLEEPDYILLTLVQGNAGATCSAACGTNEVHDDSGRCVPHAVYAQATRKSERLEARRLAQARLAAQHDLIVETQRRNAGQVANADGSRGMKRIAANTANNRVERTGTTTQQKTTNVATTDGDIDLLWLKSGPTPAVRPPLPGRMAMGGPITADRQAAVVLPTARVAPTRNEVLPWQAASLDDAPAQPLPSSEDTLANAPAAGVATPPDPLKSPGAIKPAKKLPQGASAIKKPKRYTAYEPSYKPRRGTSRGSVRSLMQQSMSGIY